MKLKPEIILSMKGAGRRFKEGSRYVTALQTTDFKAKSGQFIAVVGPSGSGKSTFLTIAGGLLNPSFGTVSIRDKNITKLSIKELSRARLLEVGFILQASNLVPYLTVEGQLKLIDRAVGRKEQTDTMQEIFRQLDLQQLTKKYPGDLSGVERQRVAIAKVLYGNSSLILADEPTASLDTVRAFEVVELLAKETHERGKATVMVTHDERLLKYCDAVFEMRDGVLRKRRATKPSISAKKIL